MNNSVASIATFVDLDKVCYTIDRKSLLKKMYRYGIRSRAYNLLDSYFSERKQRVKIDGLNSNYKKINIGVSQGTILEPLLFILYTNDSLESMPKDPVIGHADDTAVIAITAIRMMNKLLKYESNRLIVNKLSLNKQESIHNFW